MSGTFSIYDPVRLLTKSRFTDKPKKNEDKLPRSLQITILDEFDSYANLHVKINLWDKVNIMQTETFRVSEKQFNFMAKEYPINSKPSSKMILKKYIKQDTVFLKVLT